MLSQKAEETLTEFAAVKKADVQLQTQLGNRKGQIAANIIGAFAESQNSTFGWQVRAYGAENDTKGANAGIFFRRLDGESLYGINSFADYEKGDYGEFLRYGIGGELQNRYVAFAANLYLPITDDKHTGSTVAFSQKGYDANLRINIPQLDGLKVRADYYHFDGKYGGENDNGFRYGLELQPIANLRIGAFYDDGGEKFGGDIAYIYNISPPQKRELNFAPDLFSPIVREYSQRIITAAIGPGTSLRISVIGTATIRMTTAEVAITTTESVPSNTIISYATVHNTMLANRAASAQVTGRVDIAGGNYLVFTTAISILITLPPADSPRPWAITTTRNFPGLQAGDFLVQESDVLGVGSHYSPSNNSSLYSLTVVQGSESLIDPGSMNVVMTATTGTTTMTIFMDSETAITTSPIMTITTFPPLFGTTIITLGLTTNAKVDSHLPPSFPPSSFPLSFPQMPKMAFADPVILARRAGIQHNRVAIIQKPQRQYAQ